MTTLMVRVAWLFLFILILTYANTAQALSLFYTPLQQAQIDNEIQKSPQVLAVQSKHLLHLGSIMYFGPENWTVWIQGERWTPAMDKPHLHILEVSPDVVRLSVTLQGGRVLSPISLRPHQSLNLLTGKIIEGL